MEPVSPITLPGFSFTSVAEALAAVQPVKGEPVGESARRAVVAMGYLREADGGRPRLAGLSVVDERELIINLERVITLVQDYDYPIDFGEFESEPEPEVYDEDALMASYRESLMRYLADLVE